MSNANKRFEKMEHERKILLYKSLIKSYSEKTIGSMIWECQFKKYKGYSNLRKPELVKLLALKESNLTTLDIIKMGFE